VTFLSEDGRVPEEGVDQGGVSREFFQLLVAQLFNPDYGMFLFVEESRACWFNPASMESLVSCFGMEFTASGMLRCTACTHVCWCSVAVLLCMESLVRAAPYNF
jgi:hypothetical protein